VIPGEQFFEYIIVNWYWIIRLIFVVLLCCTLWVLPFFITFSPLYYDDITNWIKEKIERN
jgi:hypothetical protein